MKQIFLKFSVGQVTSSLTIPADDPITLPEEVVQEATPSNSSPQYSPSISHDEVEGEGLGGSGTSIDVTVQDSMVRGDDLGEMSRGKWTGFESGEEKVDEDWEEWSDIDETGEQERQVSSPPLIVEDRIHPTSSSQSKLVLKSKKSSQEREEKVEKGLKGRLSTEDIQRLEEQSLRAKHEPDLFADMAPKINTAGSLVSQGSSSGLVGVVSSERSVSTVSSALQYQPEENQVSTRLDLWIPVVNGAIFFTAVLFCGETVILALACVLSNFFF